MCVCCAHMRERQIQKHTETHRDIQRNAERGREMQRLVIMYLTRGLIHNKSVRKRQLNRKRIKPIKLTLEGKSWPTRTAKTLCSNGAMET